MRRRLTGMAAATLLTALAAFVSEPTAHAAPTATAVTGTGQILDIAIESPISGSTVASGTTTVTGTTSIGAPSTNVIVVMDTSGSAFVQRGLDCDRSGSSSNDNWNVLPPPYPTYSDGPGTIVDCEVLGVRNLLGSLHAATEGDASTTWLSVLGLRSATQVADLRPAPGVQSTVALWDDEQLADAQLVVRSVFAGPGFRLFVPPPPADTGTNISAALPAIAAQAATMPGAHTIAIMLTDGENTVGGNPLATLPNLLSAGIPVYAFTYGSGYSARCSPANVTPIATLAQQTGGRCTHVDDPADIALALSTATSSVEVSTDAGVSWQQADTSDGAWQIDVPCPPGATVEVWARAVASDGTTTPAADASFRCQSPPSVTAGDASGTEGSPVPISGTIDDADDDPLSLTWSTTAAGCAIAAPDSLDTTVSCTDDVTAPLTLTVDDGFHTVQSTSTLTIVNDDPQVGGVNAPTTFTIGLADAMISAPYGDAGAADTHTCTITATGPATVTSPGTAADGMCSGTLAITVSGSYTVVVDVVDDDGGAGSASTSLTVVDPAAGFVTGGGRFDSPVGALSTQPTTSATATFGFVSKYGPVGQASGTLATSTVPTGHLEFRVDSGRADFDFRSTRHTVLVVDPPTGVGRLDGVGEIAGEPGYSFSMWVTATRRGATAPDTFRLKVWSTADGQVIYDNGSPTSIAGSIVVHDLR